jgi:hypothetical protein
MEGSSLDLNESTVSHILPEECEKGDEKFQSRRSEFRPRFERGTSEIYIKKWKRYPLSMEAREWEIKRDGYAAHTDC